MSPGEVYGRWTLLERQVRNGKGAWLCRCECRLEKLVDAYHLKSGASKSCRKCSAALVQQFTTKRTHGLSKTKEYRAWLSMKTRCLNPKAKSWKYHGGAGVTVHPDFLSSFEAFLAEIGPAPTAKHTVDRKNPWGNYEPGNIRWATQAEQMANTRKAHKDHDSLKWPWLQELKARGA